jgi:hypothetical protein
LAKAEEKKKQNKQAEDTDTSEEVVPVQRYPRINHRRNDPANELPNPNDPANQLQNPNAADQEDPTVSMCVAVCPFCHDEVRPEDWWCFFCGHMICGTCCIEKHDTCPICRSVVTGWKKVYLPPYKQVNIMKRVLLFDSLSIDL